MTLVRNSVRYLHGITNERNSKGRNSVFVRYSVQEPVRGEHKIARGELVRGSELLWPSAYSGERSPEFGGVSMLANRWRIRTEFARVRRVYCPLSRLSLSRLFLALSHPCLKGNYSSSIIDRNLFYTANRQSIDNHH